MTKDFNTILNALNIKLNSCDECELHMKKNGDIVYIRKFYSFKDKETVYSMYVNNRGNRVLHSVELGSIVHTIIERYC